MLIGSLGFQDLEFVNAFFLTYRRFAEPVDVILPICDKWSEIELAKDAAVNKWSKQWAHTR